MSETKAGKSDYIVPRGKDRKEGSGFLRREKARVNSRAPGWRGEIRIPLGRLQRIIDDGGVILISAWEARSANNDKSQPWMMNIEVNFWRPGDPSSKADKDRDAAQYNRTDRIDDDLPFEIK